MGRRFDFVFRVKPGVTTERDIALMIVHRMCIKRLEYNKPSIQFVGGDSGEGKSSYGLWQQQEILDMQGLRLEDYLEAINIFTPFEYPSKMKSLLFDPRLKKVHTICIHEAREIVNAKDWQEYIVRAISSVNVLSRTHKRLNVIIIAQFIKNIAREIRETFNYKIDLWRPANRKARAFIKVIWKDDHDIEKPRLRTRPISGYLVNSDNETWHQFIPTYIEFDTPRPEVWKIFDAFDKKSKQALIMTKFNKLLEQMKKDIGAPSEVINNLVNFYSNNTDQLVTMGKRFKDKFRLSKEFQIMHGLTDTESEEFQIRLNERLIKTGAMKKLEDEPNVE